MSQYITLSYDASYPMNTPSNFYCLLDETLVFNEKYEVALTEFYYPNDYNATTLDFEISRPDYYQLTSPEFEELLNDKQQFTTDDYHVILTDKITRYSQSHSAAATELVSELRKKVLTPAFDQKLEDYKKSVEGLYELIELSSPAVLEDLIKIQREQFKTYRSMVNDFLTTENKEKIIDFINYINDFDNIINMFDEPLTITTTHSIKVQDRFSSTQLRDLLFQNFSALLYTTKLDHILKIRPGAVIKSTNPLLSITDNSKFLTIKRRELNALVKIFNIYVDIIEAPIVFNKLSSIIKIVKPEGVFNDYIAKCYNNPHYINVNKNIIYKINIQIKDQNQNFVDFNSGPITIQLHFRKLKR